MNKNVQKTPWRDVNWSAFYAAWGGWVLDGFTTFVYAFIDLAATKYLLPDQYIQDYLICYQYLHPVLVATFLCPPASLTF